LNLSAGIGRVLLVVGGIVVGILDDVGVLSCMNLAAARAQVISVTEVQRRWERLTGFGFRGFGSGTPRNALQLVMIIRMRVVVKITYHPR
jgi:hypothetical protein